MRDPHVVALKYKLVPTRVVEYDNPPPLEWETVAFHLLLEAGKARVVMKEHYATVREARERIEPLLRTWEIHAYLRRGHPEIVFDFEAPELIDRNPPGPGEDQFIRPESIESAAAVGSPTFVQSERAHPEPPKDFMFSADAEILWLRFKAFRDGKEPLPSMVQACLSLLQDRAGGRKEAAVMYGIDFQVLQKMGALSNMRGDRLEARKLGETLHPFTPAESGWLEAAIRRVILRVGEVAADPKAASRRLTMNDLPHLPKP